MSPELTKRLWEDFPELYKDKDAPITRSLIPFGFECDDGWEPLIRRMSEQLTFLGKVSGVRFTASQVKEKYGTLRFYYGCEGSGEEFSAEEHLAMDIAEAVESAAEERESPLPMVSFELVSASSSRLYRYRSLSG